MSGISPDNKVRVLGQLLGANMNVTTDQVIALVSANVLVTDIVITNASVSLTTAAGGFYSAASKGGTAIVAAGQAYTALTTALLALRATIAVLLRLTSKQLFFSLTTAQGAPATADIYVLGVDLT